MQLGVCVEVEDIKYLDFNYIDFVELQVKNLMPESEEIDFIPIKKKILGENIPVRSFNAFLPQDLQIVGENIDKNRVNKFVTTAFERMHQLGGRRVSFGSGSSRSFPKDFSKDKAEEQAIEFLHFASSVAENYDITINVEALNKTETNLIVSILEAKEIVKKVNRKNVMLIADAYHMQMENEPLQNIIQVQDVLDYIHIADTKRLYPGSGDFPYVQLLNILKMIKYTGPISIECNWINKEKEIPLASQFVRNLID